MRPSEEAHCKLPSNIHLSLHPRSIQPKRLQKLAAGNALYGFQLLRQHHQCIEQVVAGDGQLVPRAGMEHVNKQVDLSLHRGQQVIELVEAVHGVLMIHRGPLERKKSVTQGGGRRAVGLPGNSAGEPFGSHAPPAINRRNAHPSSKATGTKKAPSL